MFSSHPAIVARHRTARRASPACKTDSRSRSERSSTHPFRCFPRDGEALDRRGRRDRPGAGEGPRGAGAPLRIPYGMALGLGGRYGTDGWYVPRSVDVLTVRKARVAVGAARAQGDIQLA